MGELLEMQSLGLHPYKVSEPRVKPQNLHFGEYLR